MNKIIPTITAAQNHSSLYKGAVANIPLAISAITYGGVLGVLSAQKGVTWAEMSAMNILMFACSAQFVMIDMWQSPLSVAAISISVFIINLRYLLIGASLQPVFSGHPLLHVFSDSQKALAQYKREVNHYAAVITDMTMPNLTGVELSSEILELNPEAKIILCTGYSNKINRTKALAMGISEYLDKPVSIKKLVATVEGILSK